MPSFWEMNAEQLELEKFTFQYIATYRITLASAGYFQYFAMGRDISPQIALSTRGTSAPT